MQNNSITLFKLADFGNNQNPICDLQLLINTNIHLSGTIPSYCRLLVKFVSPLPYIGLEQLHMHSPGFDPRSGQVIQPKITNSHALGFSSETGKKVRRCPL